jgi:hypothetical protein
MTWLLAISIPFVAVFLAALYLWWESTREARKQAADMRRWLARKPN